MRRRSTFAFVVVSLFAFSAHGNVQGVLYDTPMQVSDGTPVDLDGDGYAYEAEPGVGLLAGDVPKPGTLALLLLGGLMVQRRRRQHQPGRGLGGACLVATVGCLAATAASAEMVDVDLQVVEDGSANKVAISASSSSSGEQAEEQAPLHGNLAGALQVDFANPTPQVTGVALTGAAELAAEDWSAPFLELYLGVATIGSYSEPVSLYVYMPPIRMTLDDPTESGGLTSTLNEPATNDAELWVLPAYRSDRASVELRLLSTSGLTQTWGATVLVDPALDLITYQETVVSEDLAYQLEMDLPTLLLEGQFERTIPEPGTLGLLMVGVLAIGRRH